jgi:hypothetical protein
MTSWGAARDKVLWATKNVATKKRGQYGSGFRYLCRTLNVAVFDPWLSFVCHSLGLHLGFLPLVFKMHVTIQLADCNPTVCHAPATSYENV